MRLVKCRYILSASEVLGFENLVSVSFFIRHRVHQGTWWYLKRGECGRSFSAPYHNIAFFGVPSRFKLQAASLASKFCYGRQIPRNLRSLICLLKYQSAFGQWGKRVDCSLISRYFPFSIAQLWGRQWHPSPALLPGKSRGRRSLVNCSPWSREESARLSDFTFTFHFRGLEKEMATHSSVLAWRIPGTGEPGGFRLWGRIQSDTTEAT